MTEKQSIFGRITQLARANINALIDQAEDPQKMLDQLVRDYTNSIAEAEKAIAQTIGNLRLMEQDHAEDIASAADWGKKAGAASARAEEHRGRGEETDAAWLQRQLDEAVKRRSTILIVVRFPDGVDREFRLEATGLSGGRLRGRDAKADVERTVPVRSIVSVSPA